MFWGCVIRLLIMFWEFDCGRVCIDDALLWSSACGKKAKAVWNHWLIEKHFRKSWKNIIMINSDLSYLQIGKSIKRWSCLDYTTLRWNYRSAPAILLNNINCPFYKLTAISLLYILLAIVSDLLMKLIIQRSWNEIEIRIHNHSFCYSCNQNCLPFIEFTHWMKFCLFMNFAEFIITNCRSFFFVAIFKLFKNVLVLFRNISNWHVFFRHVQ